jgi:bifunctional non-homologous end joining protein LigD
MDNIPFRVRPMLATLVRQPFDRPGWVYEEKYDGDRMLAYKEGPRVTILSRSGLDRTRSFPVVAGAITALPHRTLLLDGEIVVFDAAGVSRFQLLQEGRSQPSYAVFDCLYKDGVDLRSSSLGARRAALEEVVGPKAGEDKLVSPSAVLDANGFKAFEIAKQRGYEGLVAKDAASPYVEARSPAWLKVKVHQEDEFVVVGYTAPAGAREHIGALLLGAHVGGRLTYVGKVGTGFSRRALADLFEAFRSFVTDKPTVAGPPRERSVTWLRPHFVAQISYQELTADRKLRQPVYLGLRDDKGADEVNLPTAG